MADDLMTLADLATLNDQNAADMGATDIFNAAPLLSVLHATTASNGTTHQYIKETGAPVVGFRAANTGRDHSKSADQLVTITLKILDATFHKDKAIADAYMKGGAPALMAREAKRHLRAGLRKAEEQLINGADVAGFSGMKDELNALAHAMVISAGGSAVGAQSSVYAVRTTSDEANVCAVMGQNGNITIGEFHEQAIADSTGKLFDAYVQSILAWLGMQIGGVKSMARLANAGADGALNDSKMSDLFELFPEEAPPTHFVMNMANLGRLRKSRTATNATGAEAPYPTEWNGIPIITTSSILSTEAVVA